MSATSTTTGLPDRYRPLDQVGPDEATPTGVIRCWRAKDRVLNRDVAIRVHSPAGPAAQPWITRALTAGGLATPALAMVYDASEGTGDATAPGGAAYVVNEWIEGETLTERLSRGPLSERETRTLLRRLAEGVAEAHRVGLAVGGLTTDNVVLRPNGLVGLRAVPAATGTVEGDIAALGALLEACLTGPAPDPGLPRRPLTGSSDLLALVRRARSTDRGQGLTSVAAMVATLKERPRSGASVSTQPHRWTDDGEVGRRRRMRDPGTGPAAVPARIDPQAKPPVPPVRPPGGNGSVPSGAVGGDTVSASSVAPRSGAYADDRYADRYADEDRYDDEYDDEPFAVLTDGELEGYQQGADPDAGPATEDSGIAAPRRRLVVAGLALLALGIVVTLALWIGNTLLSVTGSVNDTIGSTPTAGGGTTSAPAEEDEEEPEPAPPAGEALPIAGGQVFDPFGDGAPENDDAVPLSFDGDPATAWSTLTYRGSPAFGNLKPGVGVLYDLGAEQQLGGVTVTSTTPGATLEIRTGGSPDGSLDSFATAGSGTVDGTTDFSFDEPVTARYVLVWLTGLVETGDGFAADLAEVSVQAAG